MNETFGENPVFPTSLQDRSAVRNLPPDFSHFHSSAERFVTVIESLSNYGTTESLVFPNTYGPTLVIFREIHDSPITQSNNLRAFYDTSRYYKFIATEGLDIPYKNTIPQGGLHLDQAIRAINNGFDPQSGFSMPNFSSVAMSEISQIPMYGVENLTQQELMKLLEIAESQAQGIKRMPDGPEKQKAIEGIQAFKDKIVNVRNQSFMENIAKLLAGSNDNERNFIPLVVGGAHAADLKNRAKDFGFSKVIIFTPNGYKDPKNEW